MAHCSIYVGDLDDPAFKLGDFICGNTPRLLGPCAFPPTTQHHNLTFHDWAKLRGVEKIKTDDCAYVVLVRQAQLVDYLDYAYGSDTTYTDPARMLRWEGEAYLVKTLESIKQYVAQLDPERLVCLVSDCF